MMKMIISCSPIVISALTFNADVDLSLAGVCTVAH